MSHLFIQGFTIIKPLILFGAGEFAELALYYFTRKGDRSVSAFVVDGDHIRESSLHGLPVLPFEEAETRFPPQENDMFVAIGSHHVNRTRARKYAEARRKGYRLATFLSPNAAVCTQSVGDNCFIPDYNNIHPFVTIGNNVLFSNANHIGHHSAIGDHCFITSNVVVGGGACIGEGSFLGVNATIRDHVSVGKYSVIGASALILKNTPNKSVFSAKGTKPRALDSSRIKKL